MLNICMCPSVRQHVLDTLSLSRCQYISERDIEVEATTLPAVICGSISEAYNYAS